MSTFNTHGPCAKCGQPIARHVPLVEDYRTSSGHWVERLMRLECPDVTLAAYGYGARHSR